MEQTFCRVCGIRSFNTLEEDLVIRITPDVEGATARFFVGMRCAIFDETANLQRGGEEHWFECVLVDSYERFADLISPRKILDLRVQIGDIVAFLVEPKEETI